MKYFVVKNFDFINVPLIILLDTHNKIITCIFSFLNN